MLPNYAETFNLLAGTTSVPGVVSATVCLFASAGKQWLVPATSMHTKGKPRKKMARRPAPKYSLFDSNT